MAGKLAIVCDSGDREALQPALGTQSGIKGSASEDSSCFDWLAAADLDLPPPDATDDRREQWESRVQLLAGRTIAVLIRVSSEIDADSIYEFAGWKQRLESLISGHVQQQLQGRTRLVFIVVFTRPYSALEAEWLRRELLGQTVFLMLHKLRVSTVDQVSVFARHIWPQAVARLVEWMAMGGLQGVFPGFYAWRALEISLDFRTGPLAESVRSAVTRWVKTEIKAPAGEGFFVGVTPGGQVNDGGQTASKARADAGTPSVAEETPDGEPGHFVDLGPGAALDRVTAEMNPSVLERDFSQRGAEWRRGLKDGAEDRVKAKTWWSAVAGTSFQRIKESVGLRGAANKGGLGLLTKLELFLKARLVDLDAPGRLRKQMDRWQECLRQDVDFELHRSRIRGYAREVDRAREAFVGIVPRAALGGICALLIGFSIAGLVEAWRGVWTPSAVPLGNVGKQGVVTLVLLAGVGAGVSLGILAPYWWEKRAGDRALLASVGLASDLRGRLRRRFDDRFELCRDSKALGNSLALADWHKLNHLLADRANVVVLGPWDRFLAANGTAKLVDATHGDKGDTPSDRAYYDRTANLRLSVKQREAERGDDAEARRLGTAAEDRIAEECWDEWKTGIQRMDRRAQGWFELKATGELVDRVLSLYAQRHVAALMEDLIESGDQIRFGEMEASASEWFRPNVSRNALPLLSCAAHIVSKEPTPSTDLMGKEQILVMLTAHLRLGPGSRRFELPKGSVGQGLVACVFERVPVQWTKQGEDQVLLFGHGNDQGGTS